MYTLSSNPRLSTCSLKLNTKCISICLSIYIPTCLPTYLASYLSISPSFFSRFFSSSATPARQKWHLQGPFALDRVKSGKQTPACAPSLASIVVDLTVRAGLEVQLHLSCRLSTGLGQPTLNSSLVLGGPLCCVHNGCKQSTHPYTTECDWGGSDSGAAKCLHEHVHISTLDLARSSKLTCHISCKLWPNTEGN